MFGFRLRSKNSQVPDTPSRINLMIEGSTVRHIMKAKNSCIFWVFDPQNLPRNVLVGHHVGVIPINWIYILRVAPSQ